MKRGLRLKFAVLFVLVVTVALGAAGVFSAVSQQRQAEKEMLEKAQVLAQEMDAVWRSSKRTSTSSKPTSKATTSCTASLPRSR